MQKDTSRYATSAKIVECLSNGDTGDRPRSATSPRRRPVPDAQLAADPTLKVWVDAVGDAKRRTADNLGTKYPKISEQLWTAIQAALSGHGLAERRARRPPQAAAKLSGGQVTARTQPKEESP